MHVLSSSVNITQRWLGSGVKQSRSMFQPDIAATVRFSNLIVCHSTKWWNRSTMSSTLMFSCVPTALHWPFPPVLTTKGNSSLKANLMHSAVALCGWEERCRMREDLANHCFPGESDVVPVTQAYDPGGKYVGNTLPSKYIYKTNLAKSRWLNSYALHILVLCVIIHEPISIARGEQVCQIDRDT